MTTAYFKLSVACTMGSGSNKHLLSGGWPGAEGGSSPCMSCAGLEADVGVEVAPAYQQPQVSMSLLSLKQQQESQASCSAWKRQLSQAQLKLRWHAHQCLALTAVQGQDGTCRGWTARPSVCQALLQLRILRLQVKNRVQVGLLLLQQAGSACTGCLEPDALCHRLLCSELLNLAHSGLRLDISLCQLFF